MIKMASDGTLIGCSQAALHVGTAASSALPRSAGYECPHRKITAAARQDPLHPGLLEHERATGNSADVAKARHTSLDDRRATATGVPR
jgi:hypothetical protein